VCDKARTEVGAFDSQLASKCAQTAEDWLTVAQIRTLDISFLKLV
jgi:hypothetical protein